MKKKFSLKSLLTKLMPKFKFKLNKRGVILLVVALLSLSTATTVIVIGALKSRNLQNVDSQTEHVVDRTDETDENNDPEGLDDSTVTPTPLPEKAQDEFIFPQEGVRPIAVIIDNEGVRVLPQGGIDQAQIVYEVITEYGITRYIALFWDELPMLIGPVRSLRHYFLDYVMEYDAILAHIGWSDYAYRDLDVYEINNIDGVMKKSGGVYWDLTRDPNNYQDSYTSPERLDKFLTDNEYRLETELPLPMIYHTEEEEMDSSSLEGEAPEDSLAEGEESDSGQTEEEELETLTASEVFIKYNTNSNCGYYYDSEARNYKRTRMGQFHIDRNTNETVRVKNIIIQYVKNESIEGDKVGRQELHTTGSGKGYFITNGNMEEITWKKNFRSTQTEYRDSNGEKIILNPGQTWIQIVPLDATVNIS